MGTRLLPNWLAGYYDYTAENEAPEAFHLWVGLSVLASSVRRNVWLHKGIFIMYPNLYIVLVAPAGMARKSTAMKMGQKILRHIPGIRLGPSSVTRERLIQILASAHEGNQSAVTLHSSEMSSIIEPSGIQMIQFLTDIYDCDFTNPEGWSHETKSQGKDLIKNPVLNIVACTTPSWLAEGLPTAATEHGFTSRTLFIYEPTTRFDNPHPKEPDAELVKALIDDLANISKLEGAFSYGPGAYELYEEMYHKIRQGIPDDQRLIGYYARKEQQLLKIAMLLSLSEGDSLTVEERDLKTALALLEQIEPKMPRAFSAVGKYEFAIDMERLYEQIIKANGMAMSDLYDKNYAVGAPVIQEMLNALVTMHRIEFKPVKGETMVLPLGKMGALGRPGQAESAELGRAFEQIGTPLPDD